MDEGPVGADEHDGRHPEDLHQLLISERPRAERLETSDLVVCHGDACLPDVLADPESLEITGMVDLGRLGLAAAAAFLAAYGLPADPRQLDVYRLLDELP